MCISLLKTKQKQQEGKKKPQRTKRTKTPNTNNLWQIWAVTPQYIFQTQLISAELSA